MDDSLDGNEVTELEELRHQLQISRDQLHASQEHIGQLEARAQVADDQYRVAVAANLDKDQRILQLVRDVNDLDTLLHRQDVDALGRETALDDAAACQQAEMSERLLGATVVLLDNGVSCGAGHKFLRAAKFGQMGALVASDDPNFRELHTLACVRLQLVSRSGRDFLEALQSDENWAGHSLLRTAVVDAVSKRWPSVVFEADRAHVVGTVVKGWGDGDANAGSHESENERSEQHRQILLEFVLADDAMTVVRDTDEHEGDPLEVQVEHHRGTIECLEFRAQYVRDRAYGKDLFPEIDLKAFDETYQRLRDRYTVETVKLSTEESRCVFPGSGTFALSSRVLVLENLRHASSDFRSFLEHECPFVTIPDLDQDDAGDAAGEQEVRASQIRIVEISEHVDSARKKKAHVLFSSADDCARAFEMLAKQRDSVTVRRKLEPGSEMDCRIYPIIEQLEEHQVGLAEKLPVREEPYHFNIDVSVWWDHGEDVKSGLTTFFARFDYRAVDDVRIPISFSSPTLLVMVTSEGESSLRAHPVLRGKILGMLDSLLSADITSKIDGANGTSVVGHCCSIRSVPDAAASAKVLRIAITRESPCLHCIAPRSQFGKGKTFPLLGPWERSMLLWEACRDVYRIALLERAGKLDSEVTDTVVSLLAEIDRNGGFTNERNKSAVARLDLLLSGIGRDSENSSDMDAERVQLLSPLNGLACKIDHRQKTLAQGDVMDIEDFENILETREKFPAKASSGSKLSCSRLKKILRTLLHVRGAPHGAHIALFGSYQVFMAWSDYLPPIHSWLPLCKGVWIAIIHALELSPADAESVFGPAISAGLKDELRERINHETRMFATATRSSAAAANTMDGSNMRQILRDPSLLKGAGWMPPILLDSLRMMMVVFHRRPRQTMPENQMRFLAISYVLASSVLPIIVTGIAATLLDRVSGYDGPWVAISLLKKAGLEALISSLNSRREADKRMVTQRSNMVAMISELYKFRAQCESKRPQRARFNAAFCIFCLKENVTAGLRAVQCACKSVAHRDCFDAISTSTQNENEVSSRSFVCPFCKLVSDSDAASKEAARVELEKYVLNLPTHNVESHWPQMLTELLFPRQSLVNAPESGTQSLSCSSQDDHVVDARMLGAEDDYDTAPHSEPRSMAASFATAFSAASAAWYDELAKLEQFGEHFFFKIRMHQRSHSSSRGHDHLRVIDAIYPIAREASLYQTQSERRVGAASSGFSAESSDLVNIYLGHCVFAKHPVFASNFARRLKYLLDLAHPSASEIISRIFFSETNDVLILLSEDDAYHMYCTAIQDMPRLRKDDLSTNNFRASEMCFCKSHSGVGRGWKQCDMLFVKTLLDMHPSTAAEDQPRQQAEPAHQLPELWRQRMTADGTFEYWKVDTPNERTRDRPSA